MTHTALSNCWSRMESERFYYDPTQAAKVWRLVLTPRHICLVGVHRNTQSKKQNRTKLGGKKRVKSTVSPPWLERTEFPNAVPSGDQSGFWDLWFHTPCTPRAGTASSPVSMDGTTWKCFCACTFVTSPQHSGTQIHWLHMENQWAGNKLWLTVQAQNIYM